MVETLSEMVVLYNAGPAVDCCMLFFLRDASFYCSLLAAVNAIFAMYVCN